MLDEGIKLAFPGARTACFVEWEAYAQACLLARMEEEILEPAPVWGDSLESFPAEQFAGRIAWISAGFPCQPHSLAGKRQGVFDERWIWEAIADIICRVGPRFVFLENVRGLLSSSAGTAFGTVLRDLAKLGFDVEWTVLRASEVGASHQRARLFILAHRQSERFGETRPDCGEQPGGACGSSSVLADVEGERRSKGRAEPSRIGRRPDAAQCGGAVADARRGFVSEPGRQPQSGTGIGPAGSDVMGTSDGAMADPEGIGIESRCLPVGNSQKVTGAPGPGGNVGHPDREREQQPDHKAGSIPRGEPWGSVGGTGRLMADPSGAGCQGCELGSACDDEQHGPDAPGSTAELCGPYLFAPGPKSELWPDIIAAMPHLAPALEPGVRMLVDGLAYVVDATRADALRCAGNGVVALQAAAAFRHLAQRLEPGWAY